MAKTVPSSYASVRPDGFFATRPIREGEWRGVNQGANYLYSRSGGRYPLLCRETPWETSSTSSTVVDASALGIDLDKYQLALRPSKLSQSGGTPRYVITLHAYLQYANVTVTLQDPTGTYADKTLSVGDSSGDWEWVRTGVAFTVAEAALVWHAYVTGALANTSPNAGKVGALMLLEDHLSASAMP